MTRFIGLVVLCAGIFSGMVGAGEANDFPPKPPVPFLSVEDELKSFVLADGYKLECVLDERHIKEPVVCVFDGNGRLYVAEMRTYMQDIDATNELTNGGRVSRHESSKGDGVFDKHTVYADGLLLPRMILAIDDRVLINETNTNDINAFADTNGDGVSDKKDLFYAGGQRGGNLEHQQSGLIWGLDNWMYQATNSFRLRVKGKEVLMEKTPGNGGQWGANQDNHGKMWYVNGGGERGPVSIQVPIIYGGIDLPEQSPKDYKIVWPLVGLADVQGGTGRFRPDTKTLNHFTATCGIEVVRGDRLPEDIRGDVLFGEPVGRLVRRSKVENHEGMTFIKNAHEGQNEFLMSTDPNFRPVNFANGPDGCLYIVDMYRGIIQEGNWTKEGSYLRKVLKQHSLDKNFGRGRIWRLTHKDFTPGPQPRMLEETPAQWVGHLGHPNGWWRDTAQRLIVMKGDKSVVPALLQMVKSEKNYLARLHAFWTLEGLEALEKSTVLEVLKDEHPQMRVAGIRGSEPFLKKGDAELLAAVQGLKMDADANVALQVLLTSKLLNVPGFSMLAQTMLVQTPHSGVRKIGSALLNAGRTFSASSFSKGEMKRLEHGEEIYRELCYSCHGFDGKGAPRESAAPGMLLNKPKPGETPAATLAPPLAGSEDVRDMDSVLRVLMSGLEGPIHNKTYDAQMVAMNTNDDEWIADVASYVRNSFGNRASMVHWMDSARIRSETKNRTKPWTIEELRKLQAPSLGNRKEWKLTASHEKGNLGLAIDGDAATRWTTGADQQSGMWLQVELPQESEVARVLLECQQSANDHPRGYRLEISKDGQAWSKVAEAKGTSAITEIVFAAVKTKFLKLTQTGSVKGLFWSIHELEIYPPVQKRAPPAGVAQKKLLAVSIALGDRAASIPAGEKLLAEMADKIGGFTVDFVKQPSVRPTETPVPVRTAKDTDETFRAKEAARVKANENLKEQQEKWLANVTKLLAEKMSVAALQKYDGVIFLNTSGELPLPDKQGFVDWVKSGKAFVGIHSAAETLREFKPYAEMLGGEADGKPWSETVSLRVVDRKSALGACFPTRFEMTDEIFQYKNLSADLKTLLALDKTNESREKKDGKEFFERGSRADKNYPLAWTREFGTGKVFYTSLGKLDEVWQNEKYQQHVLFGIEWALGLKSAERKLAN